MWGNWWDEGVGAMRRGIYLLTHSLEISAHWLPPSTDAHSSHRTALSTQLSLPSFSTAPPPHPSRSKDSNRPPHGSLHPAHTFEHNPSVNTSLITDFSVPPESCMDDDWYSHSWSMSLALFAQRTNAASHRRGMRFQLCYVLIPAVHPTHWQTCAFLSMLCSVSSWGFCKWCSLSWFIHLDIVFFILQVFAQMSPVDFCCLFWAVSLSVLPGHIMHTSIKVLLITTSIGFCVSVIQPVSEPLQCMHCTLFSPLLQVPALVSDGLNKHFWITTFSLWTILFLAPFI